MSVITCVSRLELSASRSEPGSPEPSPAKVLADILDFSVATFENYARLAGGTRGDYPALRTR